MAGSYRLTRTIWIVALVTLTLAVSAISNPAVLATPAALIQRGVTSVGGVAFDSVIRPVVASIAGAPAVTEGADGRITFLVLGSDSRTNSISRTDTIMIVSLNGSTINAASIPRDTSRIPNPEGGTFSGRINGILKQLRTTSGDLNEALQRFERVIERLLLIEIDYHVLLWFGGFTTLVDKVDPISVNSRRAIEDPGVVDDPNGPPGAYFPEASGYSLYSWNPASNPYCNGAWKEDTIGPIDSKYWCRRALIYVRSRKGPKNNDWVRTRRQQEFVASTIRAVTRTEVQTLVGTASQNAMGKWWD